MSNGTEPMLPSNLEGVTITSGDCIVCLSSGDGFGHPSERSDASRQADARNGYVEQAQGPLFRPICTCRTFNGTLPVSSFPHSRGSGNPG